MIDLLIIGSGGAGLCAALSAKENGCDVLVVSKTYPTHSQTVQAQGGINAVLYEDDDSIDLHIEDTYKASCKLSNKDNIKTLCATAKESVLWLESIGVPFNKDENSKIKQRKFGGTNKKRTCYSSDYTGLKIIHTLFDQSIKNKIAFKNEYFLLDLIVKNKRCYGAVFLDIKTGNIENIYSKSTILATGGYAGVYSNNSTNSLSNCADGTAAALRAGVKLSNIEFVQFHPTALENSNILISESARGEGAYLVDSKNKRFIDELKPRDEVTKAIYEKLINKDKVYLDLRHLDETKINKLLPQEKRIALEYTNIDITKELLPINPAAHYSMGGIKTDKNFKTNIENLYACGEVAQSSIHGANRLGGNSLIEIITFGKKAGISASNNSKNIKDIKNIEYITSYKNKIENIYNLPNKINFYEKKDLLANELFEKVGIIKNENDLDDFINFIDNLNSQLPNMGILDKSKIYNRNLVDFLEFLNQIEISKIIALCSKQRKESRGSHNRLEFKNISNEYEKYSYALIEDELLKIGFEEIS